MIFQFAKFQWKLKIIVRLSGPDNHQTFYIFVRLHENFFKINKILVCCMEHKWFKKWCTSIINGESFLTLFPGNSFLFVRSCKSANTINKIMAPLDFMDIENLSEIENNRSEENRFLHRRCWVICTKTLVSLHILMEIIVESFQFHLISSWSLRWFVNDREAKALPTILNIINLNNETNKNH